MGGILSTLNTSYSGLSSSQVLVDVTGHNISNANNDLYTRQRAVTQNKTPLAFPNYSVGQGTEVATIKRTHDEFVFSRYVKAAEEREFSQFSQDVLEEVNTYYPEIDNVGVYNDLKNYYDSWADFANNPGDPAQKVVLAQYTQTMTTNIKDTARRLENMQEKLYDELSLTVDEINRIGREIAELNEQIKKQEQVDIDRKANDLRDLRDNLEISLAKLVDADIFKSKLERDAPQNTRIADFDFDHLINIGGFALVDNQGFHPLVVDSSDNSDGFFSVFYERQDGKRFNITTDLKGGKAGAIVDLALSRGSEECIGGVGKVQSYIDDLDTFSETLIEVTNNIYAESSQLNMVSDKLDLIDTDQITQSNYNVQTGTFDIVMYNNQGDELSRRTVTIDETTRLEDLTDLDSTNPKSMNYNNDDNGDNNGLNDFDDEFEVTFANETGVLQILPKDASKGLYISIEDNGTNFAGAFGLSRFFEGSDASDINLKESFRDDPTLITGFKPPVEGDFQVANKMIQLQYEKVTFTSKDNLESEATISEFFKQITGKIASETESVITLNDTKVSVYNSIQLQYSSISQVNIDEELTNLIKFQSSYTANARVVTTVDQMIQTLLGIKQ